LRSVGQAADVPANIHQPSHLCRRQDALREAGEFGFQLRISHRIPDAAHTVFDIFFQAALILHDYRDPNLVLGNRGIYYGSHASA